MILTTHRFGGEAVSLAVNYTHSEAFAAAGYAPFMVDGTEYGEVRQYGNFSFLRVYEVRRCTASIESVVNTEQSGHEVPYYQPEASLEMFRRVLLGIDLATGGARFDGNYSSTGTANATHTEPFVALPSTSSAAASTASAATTGSPQIMR